MSSPPRSGRAGRHPSDHRRRPHPCGSDHCGVEGDDVGVVGGMRHRLLVSRSGDSAPPHRRQRMHRSSSSVTRWVGEPAAVLGRDGCRSVHGAAASWARWRRARRRVRRSTRDAAPDSNGVEQGVDDWRVEGVDRWLSWSRSCRRRCARRACSRLAARAITTLHGCCRVGTRIVATPHTRPRRSYVMTTTDDDGSSGSRRARRSSSGASSPISAPSPTPRAWCSATSSACTGRSPISDRRRPSELAERTGCDARYVREWLCAQAASGYAHYDPASVASTSTPPRRRASPTTPIPRSWRGHGGGVVDAQGRTEGDRPVRDRRGARLARAP